MAVTYWKGPGAKGDPLQSGLFEVAANWSRGAVPGAGDAAVLGKGDYTVTCSASVTLGALSIGKGATFLLAGSFFAKLELLGDSTNAGTLLLDETATVLGGTLVNTGTIAGRITDDRQRLTGGTVENHGLITNYADDNNDIFFVDPTIHNAADGTIRAASRGLALYGQVTNDGLIDAAGAPIFFYADDQRATLTNLSNTVLTGGAWRASDRAYLSLFGTTLTALGAGTDVVLVGTDARLAVFDGRYSHSAEDTLTRIDAGASLHLLEAHPFGAGQDLDLHGTLELDAGTMSLGSFDAFAGSRLTGFGTITGAAAIDGEVVVEGGTLDFLGNVTLKGDVSGKGTLELSARTTSCWRAATLRLARWCSTAGPRSC